MFTLNYMFWGFFIHNPAMFLLLSKPNHVCFMPNLKQMQFDNKVESRY